MHETGLQTNALTPMNLPFNNIFHLLVHTTKAFVCCLQYWINRGFFFCYKLNIFLFPFKTRLFKRNV